MHDQLNLSNRRSDIQGLRAIAVIFVVAYHFHFSFTHGYLGVDMFFAISGYVITQMLMKEYQDKQRLDFRSFFVRRFQRILPQLSLVVLFTLAMSIFFLSPSGPIQTNAKIGFFGLFLNANTAIHVWVGGYFDGPTQLNPLLHTWSLSIEEQFYLMYPLVFIIAARVISRRAQLKFFVVAILTTFIILSFLSSSQVIVLSSILPIGGFYGLFGRSWEFGIGAMFALIPATWTFWANRSSAFILSMIGAIMVIAPQLHFHNNLGNHYNLLTVVGVCLIILSGTNTSNPFNALLAKKPFRVIGDYSYAIYIWHWPMIVFSSLQITNSYLNRSIALVLTILASYLSHRYIEIPQLNIGRRNQVSPKLVWLLVCTLITAAIIYHAPNWITPDAVNIKQPHIGDSKGCRTTNIDLLVEGHCIFDASEEASRTKSPIFLLGDSNADHFSEAAVFAHFQLQRPLYVSNGCVFTELYVWNEVLGTDWSTECHNYVKKMMSVLKSERQSVVIISNSDHYWTDNKGFPGYSGWAVGTTLDSLTRNPLERLKLFEDSFRMTLDQLIHDGHKVIVVQTIPHFEIPGNEFAPHRCSFWTFLKHNCFASQNESSASFVQGGVRTVIQDLSAEIGFAVIDPWATLCSNGICYTSRNKVSLYRDGSHLSVAGNNLFKSVITKSILDNEE